MTVSNFLYPLDTAAMVSWTVKTFQGPTGGKSELEEWRAHSPRPDA